ncbi:MAG: XRE family transcriptional regulator, partial [Bacteroidetes bacterium]
MIYFTRFTPYKHIPMLRNHFFVYIDLLSMDIYNKIRIIRERRGIKQQMVAEALGISQQSYARMEIGKVAITIERLEQIAEVFEMSVPELWTYNIEATPYELPTDTSSNTAQEPQAIYQLQQNYINLLQKVSDLQDMTTRFSLLLEHSQAKIVASQHEIEMLHETI